MHARSMPNMRQEAIEDHLLLLWRTLPLRGVTDQEGTLADYQFALSDCSAQAVENTVNALRAGLIEDASKDFCPKAPKLAEYARAEQRRLEAINRPRMVSHRPVEHEFKDWRVIQRERTRELAQQGYVLVAENCTQDQSRKFLKPRTRWFWAIQEVWEPTR